MIDPHSVRIIEITTVKNCSVNCYPVCPQMKFREAYGDQASFLSFDNFKLALSHVPKDVHVNFAGFSEPFENSRAVDMIEYARAEGYAINLASTLVGLQARDVRRLHGMNTFDLHLPDMKGIAHIPNTPNYRDALIEVFTRLPVTHFVKFDGGFVSNERAGNCDDAPPRHVRGPFVCSKLSYAPGPVMLPNGDCVLCCMDWQMEVPLGNLFVQTYDELLQSEAYRIMQAGRWKMDGETLCRRCKWARSIPREAVYRVYSKGRQWWRSGEPT
jgi:hypothetical protein